jgi:hypothetical protein
LKPIRHPIWFDQISPPARACESGVAEKSSGFLCLYGGNGMKLKYFSREVVIERALGVAKKALDGTWRLVIPD